MLNLNHKKLDVWKKAVDFVTSIYALTNQLPSSELYGLTSQIRRAEGSARKTSADRKRFYVIARSSLVKIDTQLELSVQLKYINIDYIKNIEQQMTVLFNMLSGLIRNTK